MFDLTLSPDEVFIVIVVILAVVILISVRYARGWLLGCAVAAVVGASEPEDPLCIRVREYINMFLHGSISRESAAAMEELAADIAYDIDDLSEKKIKSLKGSVLNTAVAKVILDALLQYYIYDKNPTDYTRKAIIDDIKKLEVAKGSCFYHADMIKYLRDGLDAGKPREQKSAQVSHRESIRKLQILELTNAGQAAASADADILREEISKKNIELRKKDEEIERAKLRSVTVGTSIISDALEDCNRERRQLQEKIYELRRDIERAKSTPTNNNDAEIRVLRERVEDLRARNVQLETQLREASNTHSSEIGEIAELSTELNNCRRLLDEVLSAQN